MPSLDRTLRRNLENTVKQARRAAEDGAKKALEALAVHHHEPWPNLSLVERALRNRLRAHGRQLGDALDKTRGTQSIKRLTGECAYEHWHRMLFARFLAENDLLIESEHGVAITLDECQELAREQGTDWLELASSYAVLMLQEIFRPDDPVLEVSLPPETSSALEDLLKTLPADVFSAGDSLGWCYQFWQAERKDEVNASGNKIGADELPAVTQLFTEDYMVDFLLDNTLGAWHAGKILATNFTLAGTAQSEEELRNAVALPGCPWKYLRFVQTSPLTSPLNPLSINGEGTLSDTEATCSSPSPFMKVEPGGEVSSPLAIHGEGGQGGEVGSGGEVWTPAAGTFDGWPKTAKELKCLDPCMGSGHFEVAMFERLVALRMAEEGMDEATAVAAVIRDNLFGLEIDPRCTQIAAFNLALTAWRRVGYRPLPPMNLACSGLAPNTREADWLAVAGDDEKLRNGMTRLYRLFENAPVLGSLINPHAGDDDLLVAAFHELQPLLEKALSQDTKDDTAHELAVTARGLTKAAEILAGQYTLVATNVPYLGRGKQDEILQEYCGRVYSKSKADLATCFIERCLEFCTYNGDIALVTPQSWLFLGTYKNLRSRMLKGAELDIVVRLGSNAFQDMNWWAATTTMFALKRRLYSEVHVFTGLDVTHRHEPEEKALEIKLKDLIILSQDTQIKNPDSIIVFDSRSVSKRLSDYGKCIQGILPADRSRLVFLFWEFSSQQRGWEFFQGSDISTHSANGRYQIFNYEYFQNNYKEIGGRMQGLRAFGQKGISISKMHNLPVTLYSGKPYDGNAHAFVVNDVNNLLPIWTFCSSEIFVTEVRKIDQKVDVTNSSIDKVPFNMNHWQKVAAEKYPNGLPKPYSSDPTQWLFNGHPKGSDQPLQVAVARLLGYQWPRQTGSSFPDCPALGPDGLESYADDDGIVCLHPVNREQPAATRLRTLLATAFGGAWNAGKERELLAAVGVKKGSLEDWLSDGFFEQHCALFHQRPFTWHIWDGRRDGFNALVNYHRLAEGRSGVPPLSEDKDNPAGSRVYSGRRLLEKLIYTYLGDWITRQRQDQQNGVEGADARLAAAQHLQNELKRILEGEPPYDLFVRWKPLQEQPIGWEPDINDGVRMNIRPFMTARPLNARGKNACILRVTPRIKWEKDRGKEPQRPKEDYPWFWGWDEKTQDFAGGKAFDGVRWNNLHYSNAIKQAARERKKGT